MLAHLKIGWFGSLKPPDVCAIRCCSDCHDLVDGRTKHHLYDRQAIEAMCARALVQRLADYVVQGILTW